MHLNFSPSPRLEAIVQTVDFPTKVCTASLSVSHILKTLALTHIGEANLTKQIPSPPPTEQMFIIGSAAIISNLS